MAEGSSDYKKFEQEAVRIVNAANEKGVAMRLLGALAFKFHCPEYGYIQEALGRKYTDIDFAAYVKDSPKIKEVLESLGYKGDDQVNIFFGDSRLIFDNPQNGIHVDVFFEKLDFRHEVPWGGRLDNDSPTLPLAELLLEKMQIVQINEKDIIDTLMMLLEHELAEHDSETVNMKRVCSLCAADWGLWRTTTMNLQKVKVMSQGYENLSAEHKSAIGLKIDRIFEILDQEPKSFGWKMRNMLGDRMKWYKEVDEVK
ncbi:MAG: nucleotidyltransferase family protein [Eubacteriales bacterium]